MTGRLDAASPGGAAPGEALTPGAGAPLEEAVGACDTGSSPQDAAFVRARAVTATRAVVALSAVGAVALWTLDREAALLPAAFVLGWLNLVGL